MRQEIPELGKVIEEGVDVRRDAIHTAVTPVVAGHDMWPGDHVGLNAVTGEADERSDLCVNGRLIGIIDPFLLGKVKKGQRVWLVLYPNSITGLRHVWTHWAFAPKAPGG